MNIYKLIGKSFLVIALFNSAGNTSTMDKETEALQGLMNSIHKIGVQDIAKRRNFSIEWLQHLLNKMDIPKKVINNIAQNCEVEDKEHPCEGKTPLLYAAEFYDYPDDQIKAFQMLVDAGADPNKQGEVHGWTPLMAVAVNKIWSGSPPRLDAKLLDTILKKAEILFKAGADVNIQSADGNTALMWAARYGNKQLVKYLLGNGADPTLKNQNGKTALDLVDQPIGVDPDVKEDIMQILKNAVNRWK